MKTELESTQVVERNLLQNRHFLFLWIASIFSSFAFPMYLLAEQWYVVKSLNSPTYLGWIMMATALPRVILMIFGGVIADRFACSKVMFVTSLNRALLILGMIGLLWIDQLTISLLFVFAIFFGVLDAFFWPASESIIPVIVSEDQITRANALLQMTNQLSLLLGPMLAGMFIYQLSFYGVFAACGTALLIASLLALQIRDQKLQGAEQTDVLERLKDGFAYTKKSSFLLILMSIVMIVNFLVAGPVTVAIPLIVKQVLQGSSLDLSYLQSSFGLGTLIGAALVGLLNMHKKRGLMLYLFLIVEGVFVLLLSGINALWQGIFLLIIVGVGTTFVNIPLISMIQEKVDPEKMGRVMGLVMTASLGFLPLSYALCSSLLSIGITVSQLLLFCGIAVIVYALLVIWRFSKVLKID